MDTQTTVRRIFEILNRYYSDFKENHLNLLKFKGTPILSHFSNNEYSQMEEIYLQILGHLYDLNDQSLSGQSSENSSQKNYFTGSVSFTPKQGLKCRKFTFLAIYTYIY